MVENGINIDCEIRMDFGIWMWGLSLLEQSNATALDNNDNFEVRKIDISLDLLGTLFMFLIIFNIKSIFILLLEIIVNEMKKYQKNRELSRKRHLILENKNIYRKSMS